MFLLGIDLGTTKVASVLVDSERNELVNVSSRVHNADRRTSKPWEHVQDPESILAAARSLLSTARDAAGGHPIDGLTITGQMHGILYLDDSGSAVSPLFTWLDARGARSTSSGLSYAEALSRASGYRVAPGYGSVTHYYNVENGLLPSEARSMCTILDYVTMRLCGARKAVTDETTAASIGLFDLSSHRFDDDAFASAGLAQVGLPSVCAAGKRIGSIWESTPVFAPVADNQASFIGSVSAPRDSVLVNVGTSGQISRYSDKLGKLDNSIEPRPFPGGGFLEVGAALASGKAYEQLRTFFADVVEQFGGDPDKVSYDQMNRLAGLGGGEAVPNIQVDTRFAGTRIDPGLTGGIGGITLNNLTAAHLVDGYLAGIAEELYQFYSTMTSFGRSGRVQRAPAQQPSHLVGSGNALRRNPALRAALERRFGKPAQIPVLEEEAALGAALCAGVAAGVYPDYLSAGTLIRYEQ